MIFDQHHDNLIILKKILKIILIYLKQVLYFDLTSQFGSDNQQVQAMDDDLRILVLGEGESPDDRIEYELSKSDLRFRMLRVTSREAFINALQDSIYNLILVTAGHAEIGGLTALALAQDICPRVPCLLISAPGQAEMAARVQGNQVDSIAAMAPGIHLRPTGFFSDNTPPVVEKLETPGTTQDNLQPLLQVAGVIIVFLSPEGHILEFNRGAERLTGWRRREILGKDAIELFFPEADRIKAQIHLERVLSGNFTDSIDLPLQKSNGLMTAYRWYCNLVTDRFGQPASIMLVGQQLAEPRTWQTRPRARQPIFSSFPGVSRGRGLLTRRTGTC
jgi:PAS domain S-box-containing protein